MKTRTIWLQTTRYSTRLKVLPPEAFAGVEKPGERPDPGNGVLSLLVASDCAENAANPQYNERAEEVLHHGDDEALRHSAWSRIIPRLHTKEWTDLIEDEALGWARAAQILRALDIDLGQLSGPVNEHASRGLEQPAGPNSANPDTQTIVLRTIKTDHYPYWLKVLPPEAFAGSEAPKERTNPGRSILSLLIGSYFAGGVKGPGFNEKAEEILHHGDDEALRRSAWSQIIPCLHAEEWIGLIEDEALSWARAAQILRAIDLDFGRLSGPVNDHANEGFQPASTQPLENEG